MPAVPLALAEIEERLEEIRYLLNRRSLISVLAPALGILLGLCALLVWSASRATPGSFSLALFATIAAAIVFLGWSLLALRGRWLSIADAARFADERGGMQQRLTTALWLVHAPKQLTMTPILVADTLDRRNTWQATATVPRRRSWELAYPLAGALALAAALFFASRLPLDGLDSVAQKVKPPPHPFERQPDEAQPRPESADGESLLASGAGEEGDDTAHVLGSDGAKAAAAMSEQVRGAIRQALDRFQQSQRARDMPKGDTGQQAQGVSGVQQLASARPLSSGGAQDGSHARDDAARDERATRQQKPDLEPDENSDVGESDLAGGKKAPAQAKGDRTDASQPGDRAGRDGRDPHQAGDANPNRAEAKDGKLTSKAGPQNPPEAQNGKGETENEQQAQSAGNDAAKASGKADSKSEPAKGTGAAGKGEGKQSGGARAASGSGSENGGLFAAKGSAGTEVARASTSGTFKLTLGSFLASSGADPAKPPSRSSASAQGSRTAVTEPPSLNPNQTADDVLRRADIPPEYEEIVRRIYSSRPAK